MADEELKMGSAISRSMLEPLGAIVANFAALEEMLSFYICLLLVGGNVANQRAGQIVTAEMAFKNKIHAFASLVKERYKGLLQERTEAVFKQLRIAEEERNKVMHSVWGGGGMEGMSMRMKTTAKQEKGFRLQTEEWTRADLVKVNNRIVEAIQSIYALHVQLRDKSQEAGA
jgi:hypothetical protein